MHCKVDHNHCLLGFAFVVKAYFKLKSNPSLTDSSQAQVMLIELDSAQALADYLLLDKYSSTYKCSRNKEIG